jgi:hypothetical protein
MDLQEAEKLLAQCLKDEYDFYEKYIKPCLNKTISENVLDKYHELQTETDYCGDEIASYPEFVNIMFCWIIEINGVGYKRTLPNDLTDIDIDKLFDEYNNLAHSVNEFIKINNYNVCSKIFVNDGWQIGIMCTTEDANKICSHIHHQFVAAINMSLLIISKRFTNHRLQNLYDLASLQLWLKDNELDDLIEEI